jgi:thioredoxin-related protein
MHALTLKRRQAWAVLMAAVLSFASFTAPASTDGKLPKAVDLQADAMESKRLGVPILLFFSLKGCPYCEVIRASHLVPMQAETKPRVLIRQINLQDDSSMRGFDGRMTKHREYSQSRKINFAPVVALVDGEGNALAEPLKGAMLPDFYGAHLEDAITQATAAMRQPKPPQK